MKKTPFAVVALALLSAASVVAETPADGTAITTRIRRVTVYSDRARITRTGTVPLTDSRQRVLIPDLPVAIADASVSATSKTAKILSIEVETAYGKRTANKDAEALLEKGKVLDRRANAIESDLAVLAGEEAWLRQFEVKTHPDEKGRAIPVTIDPAAWQTSLAFVTDGLASVQSRQRAKEAEQRELQKQRDALDVEIAKVKSYQTQATKVVAIEVDGGSGSADLEVTYAILGPSWRPAYDVRVASATGKVELTTQGVVRQQTGEDWKDVELTLSTAAPAAGADLPQLLAWRLGDQQQYAYAAENGSVGVMNAGIATMGGGGAGAVASDEKKPDQTRWKGKPTTAAAERPAAKAPAKKLEEPEADESKEETVTITASRPTVDVSETQGGEVVDRDFMTKLPADQEYSAVARLAPGVTGAERTAHEDYGARAALSKHGGKSNARRTPPPPPPPPPADSSTIRATGEHVWTLPAGRVFRFLNTASPSFSWSGDVLRCPAPVVASGGFDYAFKPERKATILSDNRERKVRLSTTSMQAQLLYEVVAPLSKKAYLRGTIVNASRQPFLAGESFVFLDDDFAGRAFIGTVATTEKIELSLGVDDDIKLDRRVEQSAATSGVFTKKDRIVYTITDGLKSYKKRPVDILVRDSVPTSWQKDDISVETMKLDPAPLDEKTNVASSKGVYSWRVTIPPGGKQDVKLQYAVEHPRDFDMVETRGAP